MKDEIKPTLNRLRVTISHETWLNILEHGDLNRIDDIVGSLLENYYDRVNHGD